MGEETRYFFPWCNMNSLKLKKKSESFFVDFCWKEWFDVVNSDLLIVVFVYINKKEERVYMHVNKGYILNLTFGE